ncbi:BMP family lipoprotein [Nakamurella multipartita]|uniref:Basic membrane lipoprotein n=1 Tax=Nakamurella multipartita (strain ATCC 700099 / DSM 44233 / CIP 104796 / JCM 9543 / NBRC 105858 / Y-104) TaxID=479431 RepID=C8XDQ1_NAKMY|nr:BMP family ABC transporter substrate-binding protein [Nakamurella multipartita]ACV77715.1 basic membrane lipoprotein [Nakamurella multipartita DSM 44233]
MRRAVGLKLIAGLAAAGLVLSACSSGSSSSGTTSAAATTAASSAQSAASSAATGASGSAGAAAEPSLTGDPSSVKVGLAYDIGGRGDQSFNDLAAASLDKAKAAGVTVVGELTAGAGEPDSAKTDRLNQLVDSGATDIIAVGFAYATPLGEVAKANPDVHFAIVDDSSLADVPNVASLTFAEEQGSYLVGVAAAKKSTTGKVGFVGGVNTPLIQKFQAGFEAGVKATNPSATVTSKYISEPPDFSGFNAPDKGETIATGMYNDGIDVIYAAAGGSGAGVFKAAKATGNYAIGVDSDQYNIPSLADVKDVIITSMLKKVDVATWDFIASAVNGEVISGQHVYSLKNDGVGYSTSGGFITEYVPDIEKAKAAILDGSITVPSTVG